MLDVPFAEGLSTYELDISLGLLGRSTLNTYTTPQAAQLVRIAAD